MCWPERICRPVATPEEEALHHAIRHAVFVTEQSVFAGSDADARDDDPATVKLIAFVGGVAAGAVRLYPLDGPEGAGAGRVWQGDRLAVLADFRAYALGRPLVRTAVAAAAALGGTEMVAHVQVANTRFFERLGWERRGDPEIYVGLPHQLMGIGLRPSAPVDVRPEPERHAVGQAR